MQSAPDKLGTELVAAINEFPLKDDFSALLESLFPLT